MVPAFNEESGIAATVARLGEWLDERGGEYEILVVDNASEDATVARVEPLCDGIRVRLLRNERNRGKGFSVRRGCSRRAASCACTATPTAPARSPHCQAWSS